MAIFGDLESVKNQINNPNFNKAFEYLEKLQDKNSFEYKRISNIQIDECHKIELDENSFVLEQCYFTKPREESFFESHKKYIDIQYIFDGVEIMEVENIKNLKICENYDENKDFTKYFFNENHSSLIIQSCTLSIFYPQDAHMPCINYKQRNKVIKAVIKIKAH